jgi:hypothetical protein
MRACLAEADRRGFRSVRLCNIAANTAAFSLYHSLGFRAVDYMMHCRGLIHTTHSHALTEERQREGISIRPMDSEDLPFCNRLFIATTSFSRLCSLMYSFNAQRAEREKWQTAKAKGDAASDEPPRSCFVAEDDRGAIIGYTDGYDVDSHWVGTHDAVIIPCVRNSEQWAPLSPTSSSSPDSTGLCSIDWRGWGSVSYVRSASWRGVSTWSRIDTSCARPSCGDRAPQAVR